CYTDISAIRRIARHPTALPPLGKPQSTPTICALLSLGGVATSSYPMERASCSTWCLDSSVALPKSGVVFKSWRLSLITNPFRGKSIHQGFHCPTAIHFTPLYLGNLSRCEGTKICATKSWRRFMVASLFRATE